MFCDRKHVKSELDFISVRDTKLEPLSWPHEEELQSFIVKPNCVVYQTNGKNLNSDPQTGLLAAQKVIVRKLQEWGPMNQKPLETTLLNILKKKEKEPQFKSLQGKEGRWARDIALKLRCMGRHYAQALTKANDGKGAEWLRKQFSIKLLP